VGNLTAVVGKRIQVAPSKDGSVRSLGDITVRTLLVGFVLSLVGIVAFGALAAL
jgi:hypothetical protein